MDVDVESVGRQIFKGRGEIYYIRYSLILCAEDPEEADILDPPTLRIVFYSYSFIRVLYSSINHYNNSWRSSSPRIHADVIQ